MSKTAEEGQNDANGVEKKVNPYKLGTYDLVRLRIQRLMDNPDIPVVIPESTRCQQPKAPPEFVRNVWGSAAGVGSGDFHIYRGLRRREYARLEFIEQQSKEKAKDEEFLKKSEEIKGVFEEKTAKRRAKRQKKKAKRKKQDNTSQATNSDSKTDDEESSK